MSVQRKELLIALQDYDKDKMQLTLQGANVAAVDYAAQVTIATALQDALIAITDGSVIARGFTPNKFIELAPVALTTPQSQTSRQWVLEGMDSANGRIYTYRLGTAAPEDAGIVVSTINGVVTIDLSQTGGLAIKEAWDDFAPLSQNGNVMTLNRVYLRD